MFMLDLFNSVQFQFHICRNLIISYFSSAGGLD